MTLLALSCLAAHCPSLAIAPHANVQMAQFFLCTSLLVRPHEASGLCELHDLFGFQSSVYRLLAACDVCMSSLQATDAVKQGQHVLQLIA